jgi:hypothetical protein
MADLRQFSTRIRKLGTSIQANADNLTKRVAVAVDSTVVLETPVDTGRARSNWQVDINNDPKDSFEPFFPGEAGSTGGQNAQAAIDEGKQQIDTYNSGDTIHIVNNLGYIGELNDGSSAQAPAGFVEEAVENGIRMVKGAKIVDYKVSEI